MNLVMAKSIIDRAAIQLTDLQSIRWTRAELLDWVSDAQSQIAVLAPSATSTVDVVELDTGTRQSLPEKAWMLLAVYRNIVLGVDFREQPGRAVQLVSRSVLDRFDPNWHNSKPSAQTINYLYDVQEPRTFWVYPPSNGRGMLELSYSVDPDALKLETQTLTVQSVYHPAVLDYVLFRACSKDAEYAPGLQLAQGYMTSFMNSVAGKTAMEDKNTPVLINQQNQTRGVGS
jgi:hypothetical protein